MKKIYLIGTIIGLSIITMFTSLSVFAIPTDISKDISWYDLTQQYSVDGDGTSVSMDFFVMGEYKRSNQYLVAYWGEDYIDIDTQKYKSFYIDNRQLSEATAEMTINYLGLNTNNNYSESLSSSGDSIDIFNVQTTTTNGITIKPTPSYVFDYSIFDFIVPYGRSYIRLDYFVYSSDNSNESALQVSINEMKKAIILSTDTSQQLSERFLSLGYTDGYNDGLNDGYDNGLIDGETIGYTNARAFYGLFDNNQWYTAQTWGQLQFSKGQTSETNYFSIMFTGFFSFITALGGIQLLPGLYIWHFVVFPLVFGIIFFIIGRSGGDNNKGGKK